MAMQISTNVKVLIVTTLFYMLWNGFLLGYGSVTGWFPLEAAIFYTLLVALFVVFAALYLWGRKSGFLITLIWSIIMIILMASLFTQDIIAGVHLTEEASFLFLGFALNFAFPIVVLIFSYRAYRELKPQKTA